MEAGDLPLRMLDGADAEAYRALRLFGLRESPAAFASSHEEEAGRPIGIFRERLSARPGADFGVFAGDTLVGVAGFTPGARLKERHKGTLRGVFVHPDWRGRGLAERLTRRVIAHAAEHVERLQAAVVTSNAGARRLYRRLGFVAYGLEERALHVGGVYHDEELLVLDLSGEAAGS